MPPRKVIIILVALGAALLVFFLFRRRAQASTTMTMSPQAALATLQSTAPATLAQTGAAALINYGTQHALPVIGQGVNALIPQNEPKPNGLSDERWVQLQKVHPDGRAQVLAQWAEVDRQKAAGTYKATGFAAVALQTAALAAQQSSKNYNPAIGYYG